MQDDGTMVIAASELAFDDEATHVWYLDAFDLTECGIETCEWCYGD